MKLPLEIGSLARELQNAEYKFTMEARRRAEANAEQAKGKAKVASLAALLKEAESKLAAEMEDRRVADAKRAEATSEVATLQSEVASLAGALNQATHRWTAQVTPVVGPDRTREEPLMLPNNNAYHRRLPFAEKKGILPAAGMIPQLSADVITTTTRWFQARPSRQREA